MNSPGQKKLPSQLSSEELDSMSFNDPDFDPRMLDAGVAAATARIDELNKASGAGERRPSSEPNTAAPLVARSTENEIKRQETVSQLEAGLSAAANALEQISRQEKMAGASPTPAPVPTTPRMDFRESSPAPHYASEPMLATPAAIAHNPALAAAVAASSNNFTDMPRVGSLNLINLNETPDTTLADLDPLSAPSPRLGPSGVPPTMNPFALPPLQASPTPAEVFLGSTPATTSSSTPGLFPVSDLVEPSEKNTFVVGSPDNELSDEDSNTIAPSLQAPPGMEIKRQETLSQLEAGLHAAAEALARMEAAEVAAAAAAATASNMGATPLPSREPVEVDDDAQVVVIGPPPGFSPAVQQQEGVLIHLNDTPDVPTTASDNNSDVVAPAAATVPSVEVAVDSPFIVAPSADPSSVRIIAARSALESESNTDSDVALIHHRHMLSDDSVTPEELHHHHAPTMQDMFHTTEQHHAPTMQEMFQTAAEIHPTPTIQDLFVTPAAVSSASTDHHRLADVVSSPESQSGPEHVPTVQDLFHLPPALEVDSSAGASSSAAASSSIAALSPGPGPGPSFIPRGSIISDVALEHNEPPAKVEQVDDLPIPTTDPLRKIGARKSKPRRIAAGVSGLESANEIVELQVLGGEKKKKKKKKIINIDEETKAKLKEQTADIAISFKPDAQRAAIAHKRRRREFFANKSVTYVMKLMHRMWDWQLPFPSLRQPKMLTPIFLVLCAITTGLLGATLFMTIGELTKARVLWRNLVDSTVAQYFMHMLLFLVLNMISVIMTFYYCPSAAGSGIPQMKTVASGKINPDWLSFRCLCVKMLGLALGAGSGAYVGTLGPFVHIGCLVVNNIGSSGMFRHLFDSPLLYRQTLVVGCCLGIASALGVPIGGTLFGIEVTTTFYLTRNYWWTCVAAPIGGVFFLVVFNWYKHNANLFQALLQISYMIRPRYHILEYIAYILLGVVAGVMCLGYSFLVCQIVYRKRLLNNKYAWMKGPYVYPLIVFLVVGTLIFPYITGDFAANTSLNTLRDLLAPDMWDTDALGIKDWSLHRSLHANLVIALVMRFIFTPFIITMPFPTGLLLPTAVVGGLIGRLFGELLYFIFDGHIFGVQIQPMGYALVGACAFVAAFTQTFSIGILLMEMTGTFDWIFPIYIATIISFLIVKPLMPSIYDVLIYNGNLPFLPNIKYFASGEYDVSIKALIRTDTPVITIPDLCRSFKAEAFLANNPGFAQYAVVGSYETMDFKGMVDRKDIEIAIKMVQEHQQAGTPGSGIHTPNSSDHEHQPATLIKMPSNAKVTVFMTSLQISNDVSIIDCHMIFVTLGFALIAVVDPVTSKLVGVVAREDLRQMITKTVRTSRPFTRMMI